MSSPQLSNLSFLILGATGFIGSHLTSYLSNAQSLYLIDKTPPQISNTCSIPAGSHQKKLYSTFKQLDCSKLEALDQYMEQLERVDFIINCVAETRFGLRPEAYTKSEEAQVNIIDLSLKHAERLGVRGLVHFSSAEVYAPTQEKKKEKAPFKPSTIRGEIAQRVEEYVAKRTSKQSQVKCIVLRPAIVYGPGDVAGLSPRLVCAATYAHTKKKMKLLWTPTLAMNTVHIQDVCKAVWHLVRRVDSQSASLSIYNLCDNTDLNQQKFNNILQEIFAISVGFYGMIISSVAKKRIDEVVTMSNEMHLPLWEELKRESGIVKTPLTPYISPELIHNASMSVDGSAISSEAGFKYQHPQITTELVYQQLKFFQDQHQFPIFDKFLTVAQFKDVSMTDVPQIVLDVINDYLTALGMEDENAAEQATLALIHPEHIDVDKLKYKTKEYAWKHDRAKVHQYKRPVVQLRVARSIKYEVGSEATSTTGEGWKVWIGLRDEEKGYPRPVNLIVYSSGDAKIAKICGIGNL